MESGERVGGHNVWGVTGRMESGECGGGHSWVQVGACGVRGEGRVQARVWGVGWGEVCGG